MFEMIGYSFLSIFNLIFSLLRTLLGFSEQLYAHIWYVSQTPADHDIFYFAYSYYRVLSK